MYVNSYSPILFLIFNLRLSTQQGSSIRQISGALTVNLRYSIAMAARYLQSLYPRQSKAISLPKFICSILRTKHKNLVGFLDPPYNPPIHLILTALSIRDYGLSAKHSSFQQRELNILFLVVLSMTVMVFFSAILRISIDSIINKK